MKYIINFKNKDNQSCRVEISKTMAGNNISLEPALHPFVTNEVSDEDVLLPIRTSSAKISFIASFSVISTFISNTADAQNWRVRLYIGNDVMWCGYLVNQTYSQDYMTLTTEFTINAVDDLSFLRSVHLLTPDNNATISTSSHTYTFDNTFSIVPIKKYLSECFAHVDYDDDHYVSFEMGGSTFLISSDTLQNISVCRRNFMEPYEDENNATKFDAITCYEFLEIFCTTFCFQLRQIGTTFFFCRNVNGREYSDPISIYELDGGTTLSGGNTPYAATYTPTGTSHSQTLVQLPSRVVVRAKLNSNDDDFPHIEDNGYMANETVTDRYGSSQWALRYMKNSDTHAQKIWKWNNNAWQLYDGIPSYSLVLSDFLNNNVYSGAVLLSEDYWHGPSEDPGSAEEGETKKNYEFHQRLYISSGVTYHIRNNTEPAFIMKSQTPILFHNGGLNFKVKGHFNGHAPFVNGNSGFGPFVDPYMVIELVLRVGSKWWNGTYWVNTETYFTVNFDTQVNYSFADIISNKTLAMDFIANNYVAPIDSTMFGFVELKIIHAYMHTGQSTPLGVTYLEDIELSYCPETNSLHEVDKMPSEYRYIADIDNNGEDELTVDLQLHTNRDNQSSYGLLINNGMPIGLISNQRLESKIKDFYYTQYSQLRTYLSLDVKHQYHGNEESYLSDLSGSYIPLAYSEIDWRDLSSKILFVKALPSA